MIANYQRILRRDNFRCRYCGIPLNADNFSIDHFIPSFAHGGDDDDNLVSSCRRCNGRKQGRIYSSVEHVRQALGITYRETSQAIPFECPDVRKRSGKLSKEGERRKKAAWRAKNRSLYNKNQRELMRKRRSINNLTYTDTYHDP